LVAFISAFRKINHKFLEDLEERLTALVPSPEVDAQELGEKGGEGGRKGGKGREGRKSERAGEGRGGEGGNGAREVREGEILSLFRRHNKRNVL
jgi:hypothetical protein